MAIRAFLSTWTASNIDGGLIKIDNPIVDYVDANSLDVSCRMYYPDRDLDGLPDKNRVLIFTRSLTLTGSQMENAKNLTGVSLIPPFPLDTVLSDIPAATRQTMLDIVNNNGIPTDGITLDSLYVDVLNTIIVFFVPSFPGIKNLASEEFG
jgi:hypothetical protein